MAGGAGRGSAPAVADNRHTCFVLCAVFVRGDQRAREPAGYTAFVQIRLPALMTTPGLGRVIIGSLLNAVYEAQGETNARILFLLDEVARLGRMKVIETARDVGRK
jgi:type IV secretory pathway TraG/TraD family ATPase VirD4